MSKHRSHSSEFKARLAMKSISGRETIKEITADHAIHPMQVRQWKKHLLDCASELFTREIKPSSPHGVVYHGRVRPGYAGADGSPPSDHSCGNGWAGL